MNYSKAKYKWTIEEDNVIFLEDLLGDKSITNDIENILLDFKLNPEINISDYNWIYRDSLGIIDGIYVDKNGKFNGFYPIVEKTLPAAKLKIRK